MLHSFYNCISIVVSDQRQFIKINQTITEYSPYIQLWSNNVNSYNYKHLQLHLWAIIKQALYNCRMIFTNKRNKKRPRCLPCPFQSRRGHRLPLLDRRPSSPTSHRPRLHFRQTEELQFPWSPLFRITHFIKLFYKLTVTFLHKTSTYIVLKSNVYVSLDLSNGSLPCIFYIWM